MMKHSNKFEVREDKPPTLEEAQAFVGGLVQMVEWEGGQLLMNEEGKLEGLPINEEATVIFVAHFGPGDYVAGNCLLLKGKAMWE